MKESTKKVNKNKIIGIAAILIIIIISIVVIFIIVNNNNKYIDKNIECSELEKISLETFVKNTKVENLIETVVDQNKEEIKIRYAINQYLNQNQDVQSINLEEIINIYENIFGKNEETTIEKIGINLMNVRGIVFNNQTQQYEKQFSNSYDINNIEDQKYKTITAVKKLKDNQYILTLDIVESINIEELKNYYFNIENAQKANIDINELNQLDENTSDLYKYLNQENYKKIAIEIKTIDVTIKVENSKIIIENF